MKLLLVEVNFKLKIFIGNVLYALGRNEEAIEDYTRALEKNPQRVKAFYNRG